MIVPLAGYEGVFERTWEGLSIIYFLLISVVLFVRLYKEKNLNINSIYSVFSGFILLCIAFAFLLMFINRLVPGSINGLVGEGAPSDYIYFSFITLLTIGYGDITPETTLAKKVIILIALIGYFYTVFVTALIIGKLINQKDS